MKNFLLLLLSLLGGSLLVAAFAPINGFLLAFVAPAILLYCWKNATPKQAFWRGLLFGVGLFGTGTSWIYYSIHNFGNANAFEASLVTILFTLFFSLYLGLQGYFFRKLFRKKTLLKQCLFAFPVTWVIFEGLRTWAFTGFPWLLLGYSQTGYFLDGYAPIFSVFGISLVVALISGAIVVLASKVSRTSKLIAAGTALGILLLSIPLHFIHWTKPAKRSVSVALVQGNIPQQLKWSAEYEQSILTKYLTLTQKNWNHELIVWPEAAIPSLQSQSMDFINALSQQATEHHSSVIFGIPADKNGHIYNAIMVVGEGKGIYYKRHLVPFGEYTPLPTLFEPIMRKFNVPLSDLSKGPAHQAHLLAQGLKIAPFICYEITYPDQVAQASRGSQLLVVISDDSWFGNSLASAQQLQMAQMRAIETGRSILYVNNTDHTTIIQSNGQILEMAPSHKTYVYSGNLHPVNTDTPFMHFSFYPLTAAILLLFVLSLL